MGIMADSFDTIFYLLKNKQYQKKFSKELENQFICYLRSQEDENYKLMVTPILSSFLSKLVRQNDKSGSTSSTVFDAPYAPDVSIQDYLRRMVKYTPCSKECFLVAFIYIDRIIQDYNFVVTSFNVHRLLITSFLVASKVMDDHVESNKYYSHVGGIQLRELNSLETHLLMLLHHDLTVSSEVFESYRYETERHTLIENYEQQQKQKQQQGSSLSNRTNAEEVSDSDSDDSGDDSNVLRPFGRKQLRRSKSLSGENNLNNQMHRLRARRASSFHIDMEVPLFVIA